MIACVAGSADVPQLGGSPTALTTWAISLWVRTTTSAAPVHLAVAHAGGTQGVVIGLHMGHGGTGLFDGNAAAGRIGVRVIDSDGYMSRTSCAATVADGALHHLLVVSDGSYPAVYVDGAARSMTTGLHDVAWDGACTPEDWLLLSPPVGLGLIEADCDIGELAVLGYVPSAAEIAALAAGWSPLALATWPLRYLRGIESLDARDYLTGEIWGTVPAAAAAGHVAIIEPGGPVDRRSPDWRGGSGYDVYVTAGRRAVPGSDTPVAVMPPGAVSAALRGLAYTPSVVHSVEIYARNATGRASSSPAAEVAVDSGGTPALTPAAVSSVRASARAGGYVWVTWTYVETSPLAVADRFDVIASPIDVAGQGVQTLAVPHVAPQQQYSAQVGPLLSGRWRLEVRAVSAGGAAIAGAAVADVIADQTAPLAAVPALEVA